jgi:hypothetical protein
MTPHWRRAFDAVERPLASHGDIIRTQNQIGQLEREVRALRRGLERYMGASERSTAPVRKAA